MKSATLLLSGGLDSAANLALAPGAGCEVKACLTVDYGQRSASREKAAARALAACFGAEHVSFELRGFARLVGTRSAIFPGGKKRLPSPASLDDWIEAERSARAVWVPNRNGVLLSLAAALAESRRHAAVLVGFNAEEAATFPDNSVEYMRAMTGSLKFSTANGVEIVSATAGLRKEEIVRRLPAGFPYALLWSCYSGGERQCGACESCRRLRRAVERGLEAGAASAALEELFGARLRAGARRGKTP